MKLIQKTSRAGFTLIELIIVIAIIGILAVALLAALNPVEQTNRAKDSSAQVAAKALYDAINRYYATQQVYAWCTSSTVCTDISAGVASNNATWVGAGGVGAPTATSPQGKLETNGELKTGYLAGVSSASTIFLSATGGTGANSNPLVCYAPVSSAQQNIPGQTYYSQNGGAVGTTKYICLGK